MQIQLDIINRNGLPQDVATGYAIGQEPVVIGRAGTGWVLPDATRFLSSSHCRIGPAIGGFEVSVLSANGIVLNGEALAKGRTAPIRAGDRLEIGPYIMAVAGPLAAGGDEKTIVLRRARATGEKTIVLSGSNPAAGTAPANDGWVNAIPLAAHRPSAQGSPRRASSSSQLSGAEFVREFAFGARLDPDELAGRTDAEFARELGSVMQKAAEGMEALSRSARELRLVISSREIPRGIIGDDILSGSGFIGSLFGVEGPAYRNAEQAVGDLMADLRAHDAAVFSAMQTALFRLLNDISPMTIEAETGSGALRPKRAANWTRYAAKWGKLSLARENGMLDVFLEYFREAYDDRMGGH